MGNLSTDQLRSYLFLNLLAPEEDARDSDRWQGLLVSSLKCIMLGVYALCLNLDFQTNHTKFKIQVLFCSRAGVLLARAFCPQFAINFLPKPF